MARVATSLLKRLCPDHSVAEPDTFFYEHEHYFLCTRTVQYWDPGMDMKMIKLTCSNFYTVK